MQFGLSIFPTEHSATPQELGRAAEERGFESLFFPEHTHIPASRRTPYPGGGELPQEYWQTLDPFVALTAAACATERLRLGTGICLIVERDPITTAKEIASLDVISGGRFLLGVGAGWNLEEMENHGTDPSRRFGLMRERIEAMKAIWTQDEAEYHGRQVAFDPIWAWPKPVHKPHPPVLVGGNGPTVHDRVLAFGDEWMPNNIGNRELLCEQIEELRRRGHEEQGREIGVTLHVAPSDPRELEAYERAGVGRALFILRSRPLAELEERLNGIAALMAEYGRA